MANKNPYFNQETKTAILAILLREKGRVRRKWYG